MSSSVCFYRDLILVQLSPYLRLDLSQLFHYATLPEANTLGLFQCLLQLAQLLPVTEPAWKAIVTDLAAKHGLDLDRLDAIVRFPPLRLARLAAEIPSTNQPNSLKLLTLQSLSKEHHFPCNLEPSFDAMMIFHQEIVQKNAVHLVRLVVGGQDIPQVSLTRTSTHSFYINTIHFAAMWAHIKRDPNGNYSFQAGRWPIGQTVGRFPLAMTGNPPTCQPLGAVDTQNTLSILGDLSLIPLEIEDESEDVESLEFED